MRIISGLNIQYPISQLILDGKKTIETRRYPLPIKYLGVNLAIIETPGPERRFKARIVGIIQFVECFEYKTSDQFQADCTLHFVTKNSPWKWSDKEPRWGWIISNVEVFNTPLKAPIRKGIVFTSHIVIP